MIKIAGYYIKEEDLCTKKTFNRLKKLDSGVLAEALINLTIEHEQLHYINSNTHAKLMSRKKGVGGITVDA